MALESNTQRLRALPTEPDHGERVAFNPDGVFYDCAGGNYLVDIGIRFRTYGRKGPVLEGVTRWHAARGLTGKEAGEAAREDLTSCEVDRAVDWAGDVAGHGRGLHRSPHGTILVLSSPILPSPKPGPFPTIAGIIRQGLGAEPEQAEVFTGWLAHGWRAVREGVHCPAPMMVLAGPPNGGKSLVGWITGQVLGGRAGSPYTAWTGTLPWNDDIIGSELLLIDDSVASHDIRARREFAARFKEAIYAPSVQLRKRRESSISVRPVWRVMVCCNDNPESLQIIPPLDDDLADKVSILRFAPVVLQLDASGPEGKTELQRIIKGEIPAFTNYLNGFTVAEDLRDTRSGVRAWQHPALVESLGATSPERQLAGMLALLFARGHLPQLDRVETTAADLEAKLTAPESPCRDQARGLLGKWPAACGVYLGKLARTKPELVAAGPQRKGIQTWHVFPPAEAA